MDTSRVSKPKTFGNLPIDNATPLEVARLMANALGRDYGDSRSRDKQIAKDTGATPKTAGNWCGGHHTMHLVYALRALARSAAVRREVERLTGLEITDPDSEREMSRAVQRALGNP